VSSKRIEEVLAEHTPALLDVVGVVGTGQGELSGKPCIKVFVSMRSLELEQRIPVELDGYPLVIEEVGEPRALQ
jgi:hypothetical protein